MARIIKWLGNSWGIDAEYFVRGGIYGAAQQAIGLVCGLAIIYAFGHFVPPAVFGEYNLVISILSLLAIVSLPGMNTAVLQSVGRGHDQSLTVAVKAKLAWSMIGIPILLGLAYYYRLQGSDIMPAIMVLAAVFFPLTNPWLTTQSFFVAKKRFDWQAVFSSISSIVTAILVSGAIIWKQNLWWAMLAYFLGTSLPWIISFGLAKTMVRLQAKTDAGILSYGYFLTGLQILPLLAANVGNILLASWLGVSQLAIFSVASKFPGIVQKNWDVFYKPVTAKLAGQAARQHHKTLARHITKFVILGAVLFGVTWLTLPWLIKLFFSEEYANAVIYGRWYSLMLLTLPVNWLLNDIIVLQKRRGAIFVLQTWLPLIKLASYFWVIPRWHIGGLVAIMLAERMVATVYSGLVVKFAPAQKD